MRKTAIILLLAVSVSAIGQNNDSNDPALAKFKLKPAPKPQSPWEANTSKSSGLSKFINKAGGWRVAICGDSITEQKMYSRIMETYLTVCVPELNVSVRQFGWSGERAPGFLSRMTDDALRFHPDVATTCYGMNDHEYRPYQPSIGEKYREYSTEIIHLFKQTGTFVIHGAPGCVGRVPTWTGSAKYTIDDLNLNLCELRNIGVEIAREEKVNFADVFGVMIKASSEAHKRYGADYAVSGKDGVHPGWAGQLIMAYSFLKSMGLNGDIGTFTIDPKYNQAYVSQGHERLGFKGGNLQILSHRYPFCAAGGDVTKDDNIRSGMSLVPFNQELNRLMLVVTNATAKNYKVTWGSETRSYSAEQLAKGVNIAEDFEVNPFTDAFTKVDEAVTAKQSFETWQIKEMFNGALGRTDLENIVEKTEKAREPLAAAIKAAMVPVKHTLRVVPE